MHKRVEQALRRRVEKLERALRQSTHVFVWEKQSHLGEFYTLECTSTGALGLVAEVAPTVDGTITYTLMVFTEEREPVSVGTRRKLDGMRAAVRALMQDAIIRPCDTVYDQHGRKMHFFGGN